MSTTRKYVYILIDMRNSKKKKKRERETKKLIESQKGTLNRFAK